LKTVRFSRVVDAAGRPRPHTLWVAPERDPEFKRAQTAHRVMTIAHERGKTDVGAVGYAPGEGGSEFLVFPKSLARFAGARVVGVDFDLVEQPKLVAAKAAWKAPPADKKRPRGKGAEVVAFEPAATKRAPEKKAEPDAKYLLREIRAALKELDAGKSMPAYRRLERALAKPAG
jgi:hypothetical protein